MKSYTQISGEIGEFSDLPFWKKADTVDLAYVGYGLFIVTLVVMSYLLGSFNLLPHDPQDIDLELMMAGPGTAGHLLGTDFMGRDMLSRLIVGIQAYFLPGLLGDLHCAHLRHAARRARRLPWRKVRNRSSPISPTSWIPFRASC